MFFQDAILANYEKRQGEIWEENAELDQLSSQQLLL